MEMVGTLVAFLIVVVIIGLVYWAVHRLAAVFGLSEVVTTVLDVILVIVIVLWLIRYAGLQHIFGS